MICPDFHCYSEDDRISSCSISIRGIESRRSSSRHYDPSPIHENLLEGIIEYEQNDSDMFNKADQTDEEEIGEHVPLNAAGLKSEKKEKPKKAKLRSKEADPRPPMTIQAQQKCPKCRVSD